MSNKRLMIVDAHNQFMRSYIVDPSTSHNGMPIGGVKGFLKILNKLTRLIKPTEIVIVWDGEGGSQKRRAVNKNYKAGRKPPRLNRVNTNLSEGQEQENKIWQQLRLVEYINSLPIIQFVEPGIEADDVISFVANSPHYKEWQKVIVSSDKDFFQLLDDKTLLMRPIQDEVLNKNAIIEKFGIHPRNFALARSLAGDPSDNLPGVPGVGLGTISKRFSFLKEDKEYLVDDLINFAEERSANSKLKVFTNVLSSANIIRQNFKLMQLYSPSISVQTKNRIKSTIANFYPTFNKTELRSLMIKDGVGEISLNDLYEALNRIESSHPPWRP